MEAVLSAAMLRKSLRDDADLVLVLVSVRDWVRTYRERLQRLSHPHEVAERLGVVNGRGHLS